jgi:hypothetical protein
MNIIELMVFEKKIKNSHLGIVDSSWAL